MTKGRKSGMIKVKEKDIQRTVKDYLEINGWFVIRIQQGLGCHLGISDLIAVRGNSVAFIEIKKPGGKLSRDQEKFRADIERSGGCYLVAMSLEDIMFLGAGRL